MCRDISQTSPVQAKWWLVRRVTPGHSHNQTVLGHPSQPTTPIRVFFLRLVGCRIHTNTIHILSPCLPCAAAFCTVVFRAKAKLYCLYVHLLSASVVWLRVNVFPLKQSHKTGCALCKKAYNEISSVSDNNSDLLCAKFWWLCTTRKSLAFIICPEERAVAWRQNHSWDLGTEQVTPADAHLQLLLCYLPAL